MSKGKIGGFTVHLILLLVLFLSLINGIFEFHGKLILGELLVFVFFFLIALVAMGGQLLGQRWGNTGLFMLYGLNLINVIFIWLLRREVVVLTTLIAVFGFIWTMVVYSRKEEEDDFDGNIAEEIKPMEETKVKTSFEPGKYVASKTGKKFHAPKCDWAKRINKKSQVWFDDEEEAKEKGYKACDCVE